MNKSVFVIKAYAPDSNVSMGKNYHALKTFFQCLQALSPHPPSML